MNNLSIISIKIQVVATLEVFIMIFVTLILKSHWYLVKTGKYLFEMFPPKRTHEYFVGIH